MKKMNRHILAALIGTAVLFAACEGPMGPAGLDGKDGTNGINGTNGADGARGDKGDKGDPGQGAYELWLEQGNEGSKDDFLASLIGAAGKDAHQLAVSSGAFTGTLAEWLASLNGQDGTNGTNGTNGKDAYEIAKELDPTIGTRAEWIASLVGPAGQTAYDLAVLGGYEGSLAEWLLSLQGAKGDKGEKGDPGQSAFDIWVAMGNTGKTMADFITFMEGQKGENGQTGPAGQNVIEMWKALPGNEGRTDTDFWESIKGAQGNEGGKGDPGNPGDKGEPGNDGKSAAVMHPLWMGTFPVIVEDQTGEIPSERVDLIQDALSTFNGSENTNDTTAKTNITGGINKNIRIIIKDLGSNSYNAINRRLIELDATVVKTETYANLYLAIRGALRAAGDTPTLTLFKANGMPHLAMGEEQRANKKEQIAKEEGTVLLKSKEQGGKGRKEGAVLG
jgi:hypothetical protein